MYLREAFWLEARIPIAAREAASTPAPFDYAVSARLPSMTIRAFPKVVFLDTQIGIGKASTTMHCSCLLKPYQSVPVRKLFGAVSQCT